MARDRERAIAELARAVRRLDEAEALAKVRRAEYEALAATDPEAAGLFEQGPLQDAYARYWEAMDAVRLAMRGRRVAVLADRLLLDYVAIADDNDAAPVAGVVLHYRGPIEQYLLQA